MKKTYSKLIISLVALILAVTMIISVSYAWITVSRTPTANGMQVAIGGGKAILLAQDITETVTDKDGTHTVHYPGKFSNKLTFNTEAFNENYKLSPVSTADGLNWIVPTYNSDTGAINDINSFIVDDKLSGKGYAYLDFWIVSPGSEYDVHISMDTKSHDGSYFVEVPEIEESDSAVSGFTLKSLAGRTAAGARVGFLVNSTAGSTASMQSYIRSSGYNSVYKRLVGDYQEKGESFNIYDQYKFTVYEPNGTYHPFIEDKDGWYIATKPLAYDRYLKKIYETDISDRLAVQKKSSWKTTQTSLVLENILQASLINSKNLTTDEAKTKFYANDLQWQISNYIQSENFFKSTASLYAVLDTFGEATPLVLEKKLSTGGAADDIVITRLEKDIPQRIRMFIWIEGQDADCTNDAYVPQATVALSLELSGATPNV